MTDALEFYDEAEPAVKIDDKLKAVRAETVRLEALSEEDLDDEFKLEFNADGKRIDTASKIAKLMTSFVERNRPNETDELATKLYDDATNEWKVIVDKKAATLWEKISELTKFVAQYATGAVNSDGTGEGTPGEGLPGEGTPVDDCEDESCGSSEISWCDKCVGYHRARCAGSLDLSDVSSRLSTDSLFYDSDETCDYSGYSHDYFCSKHSKMRAADETKLEAKFRVEDKLKLVLAEEKRVNALSDAALAVEFTNRFRLAGKTIDRKSKVVRLINDFVRRNRPYKEYRLSNKFYTNATSKWNVLKPIELETIDVVEAILATRHGYDVGGGYLSSELRTALDSENESRSEKTSAVYKLATAPLGLCSNSVERFIQRMCAICIETLFPDKFAVVADKDDGFDFQAALRRC